MRKLSEAEEGKYYHVTWMIGRLARNIADFMNIRDDDVVYVDRNYGKGGVIVSCHGRRICMDRESAASISVKPAYAWRVA